MLRITKRVKELTDEEVKMIPTIEVTFNPSDVGARMTLEIGDLSVYEDVYKHQVLKLFPIMTTWNEIMASGTFKRRLPLRIFVGKTESANNYRGRYYRYEVILPNKGAISSMFPDRINDYLKEREGANLRDHIHLVDGEWL